MEKSVNKKSRLRFAHIFIVTASLIVLINFAIPGFAQHETAETAENLMFWQLAALKDGDYHRFIEHGNKAFKELMDENLFDTLILRNRRKLAKGYKLEYLGAIRRLGMREHLWRVDISGDKYELLGSLSLSNGKVVGFNID